MRKSKFTDERIVGSFAGHGSRPGSTVAKRHGLSEQPIHAR